MTAAEIINAKQEPTAVKALRDGQERYDTRANGRLAHLV
jgi:hypothetical protein